MIVVMIAVVTEGRRAIVRRGGYFQNRAASPDSNRDVIPAVIQERLEELQWLCGLGADLAPTDTGRLFGFVLGNNQAASYI
jgi:hypothetical protein